MKDKELELAAAQVAELVRELEREREFREELTEKYDELLSKNDELTRKLRDDEA
jgi:hypothetical protein|tara:strand:+ start:169 stop:330 length:162 start_codon:yes stop_codon:yes gene_type:complete